MRNDEKRLFDEIFELFVVPKTASGVSDATLRSYHYHMKSIERFLDTERPMNEITKRDVERTVVEMKNAGIKHNSIATYVRFLKTFFNWCESEEISAPKANSIKEKETVKETCTDEELERFLRKPEKQLFCLFACDIIKVPRNRIWNTPGNGFYFGKNAFSAFAYSGVLKDCVAAKGALHFSCVVPFGVTHFLFFGGEIFGL